MRIRAAAGNGATRGSSRPLVRSAYEGAGPVAYGLATLWEERRFGSAWASARRGRRPFPPEPELWIHGASAGEVASGCRLAKALGVPLADVAVTASNPAGLERARRAGAGHASALAFDTPARLRRFLGGWRPRLLVIVETELWPILVDEAAGAGIPTFLVDGRLRPADARRYRWIGGLVRPMLERFEAIWARDDAERERFLSIGAPPDRTAVGGSLKGLVDEPASGEVGDLKRRIGLGPDERTLVVGSLHGDECGFVLEALRRAGTGSTRVVVAPRHAEDGPKIVARARDAGWSARLHSDGAGDWSLLVLDTIGDLPLAFATASVAIVGGGFANHGGHNFVEAIAAGAAVLVGPDGRHFAVEHPRLERVAPESIVRTPDALAKMLRRLLDDDRERRSLARRQRTVLEAALARGDRYRELLRPWLASPTSRIPERAT